eukprot:15468896-Alexandrium_andersonii.AAC.1
MPFAGAGEALGDWPDAPHVPPGNPHAEPTHVPDAALHLRPAQELRRARPLPRSCRGRVLMEEARA